MGKVLFSCIGTSDPVRAYHDAAWLHCCRHAQPELTVIYLSAEMTQYEENRQLYSHSLKLLNQDLREQGKREIALEVIKKPELVNPHEYGTLYSDFIDVLTKLHNRFPEETIDINCSSGTPAMKHCMMDMQMVLPFGQVIRLLQVDGPDQGKDYNEERIDSDYDLLTQWELNQDRNPDAICRMHVPELNEHDALMMAEFAKKLVRRHDYSGAKLLIENYLPAYRDPEKLLDALHGAESRKMLMCFKAGILLEKAGIDAGRLKDESKDIYRKCAEMILTMQNDLEARDYANMIRKLTPPLFALTAETVRKHIDIDLLSFIGEGGNVNWGEIRNKNNGVYELINNSGSGHLYTSNILPVLENRAGNAKETGLIRELRRVEDAARNKAAHDLTGIDDKWLIEKTKMSPEEILKKLKLLLALLAPKYNTSFWNAYRNMDEEICKLLEIRKK